MKLNVAAVTAILSTFALAAPLEERAAEAAASGQWTIQNMKRVCNSADTSCTYTFSINTHTTTPVTPCKFTVKGANASEQNTYNHVCGPFTVGTGWVNQNGPGNGFVVLPTLWAAKSLEAYPSYSDADLNTNKVIKPNRSFAVQNV